MLLCSSAIFRILLNRSKLHSMLTLLAQLSVFLEQKKLQGKRKIKMGLISDGLLKNLRKWKIGMTKTIFEKGNLILES